MDALVYEQGLVRALLRDQHPDLAELELRDVGGGWDNQQWRLGDQLAVRLPRTERGPELLRKEHAWLPVLAPRLPLPTPVPVRLGEPSAHFTHPWTIARWVDGSPADTTPITDPDSAEVLANFLRALHEDAPEDAPTSTSRGVPLADLAPYVDEPLEVISDHPSTAAVREVWRTALDAPAWQGPALWLHGDLHPANVVVRDGALAGVLDFGDLCVGDPATDLSAAWILLPTGAVEPFLEVYGADEATIARARGWAVLKALMLIAVGVNGRRGLPGGKPTWEPAGYATIERLLTTT